MASLRYTHHVPVVIVTEGRPPADFFDEVAVSAGQKMSEEMGSSVDLGSKLAEQKRLNHSDLYIIRGNPRDPLTLAAAGVATCGRICTLASNTGYTGYTSLTQDVDPFMLDATNLLTASVLESVLSEWEHANLAVVYDWHSQSNIVQLPRTPKNRERGGGWGQGEGGCLGRLKPGRGFTSHKNTHLALPPCHPVSIRKFPRVSPGGAPTSLPPLPEKSLSVLTFLRRGR